MEIGFRNSIWVTEIKHISNIPYSVVGASTTYAFSHYFEPTTAHVRLEFLHIHDISPLIMLFVTISQYSILFLLCPQLYKFGRYLRTLDKHEVFYERAGLHY